MLQLLNLFHMYSRGINEFLLLNNTLLQRSSGITDNAIIYNVEAHCCESSLFI